MSGFLFARLQFQQFVWPRHRLSVALPLGINGAARHSKTGRLGLNNRQPLPYLCSCGSKNRAGRSLPQRRPATNVALGPAGFGPTKQYPILPGSQQFSPTHSSKLASILSGSACRPSPPEALRAWAARPAVQRTAEAQPICFRPQPAENEDGAQAEYFGPHPRLRADR